jgi:hypothetical protein
MRGENVGGRSRTESSHERSAVRFSPCIRFFAEISGVPESLRVTCTRSCEHRIESSALF